MTLADRLLKTRVDHLASTVQLTKCRLGKRTACACAGTELALRITSELEERAQHGNRHRMAGMLTGTRGLITESYYVLRSSSGLTAWQLLTLY